MMGDIPHLNIARKKKEKEGYSLKLGQGKNNACLRSDRFYPTAHSKSGVHQT